MRTVSKTYFPFFKFCNLFNSCCDKWFLTKRWKRFEYNLGKNLNQSCPCHDFYLSFSISVCRSIFVHLISYCFHPMLYYLLLLINYQSNLFTFDKLFFVVKALLFLVILFLLLRKKLCSSCCVCLNFFHWYSLGLLSTSDNFFFLV